jgi:hypothetical protein
MRFGWLNCSRCRVPLRRGRVSLGSGANPATLMLSVATVAHVRAGGPAHMRLFSAKGMAQTRGMCARVTHMRALRATGTDEIEGICVPLAHMMAFRAKAMAGNEGRCVRAAHMCRLPASCSRTCGRFRPESRPAAGKPGEVRELGTEKRQETRGSARETPGNRGTCARTSAGFVPSGREAGRNQGEVRGSMARTRGKCVRLAHMRPFRATGMAGTKGMCAGSCRRLARNPCMCAMLLGRESPFARRPT